jgi:hypothetical protein
MIKTRKSIPRHITFQLQKSKTENAKRYQRKYSHYVQRKRDKNYTDSVSETMQAKILWSEAFKVLKPKAPA